MPILKECLKKFLPFSCLDDNELSIITKSLTEKRILAGEIIIWEGDSSDELYLIEKGWLKVVKSTQLGREIILNILGPGDVFNALAAFVKIEVPATVIALENGILHRISNENMSIILDHNPAIARNFLQQIALRLQKMTDFIGDLSLKNVEARLADLLISKAEDNIFYRQKWLTQSEMAAMIGTVPDVINRLLNNFVEIGLIKFDRYKITILEPDELKAKIIS